MVEISSLKVIAIWFINGYKTLKIFLKYDFSHQIPKKNKLNLKGIMLLVMWFECLKIWTIMYILETII
jgi:hypothetical protein